MVTNDCSGKTLFLIEVQQGGLFEVAGYGAIRKAPGNT